MAKRIWDYPGVYIAWGLDNNTFTAEELVAKAAGEGYKWFALEVPATDTAVLSLRLACRKHKCFFGIWEVSPTSPAVAVAIRPNFYIANIETPYSPSFIKSFRGHFPRLPSAVVTNFGGLDSIPACKPWIDAGFVCQPEAYLNENPDATPDALIFEAVRRGWKEKDVYPTFGVYHDFPASNYKKYINKLPGWSVYLAEGMHDTDWGAL